MPTSESSSTPAADKKSEKDAANKLQEAAFPAAASGGGGDGPGAAPIPAPTLDASLSPGATATSPLNISDAVSASLEVLQLRQENDALKNDVQDRDEKLDTLKLKRQEDKNKLKDMEKLKIQLEELQRYKVKMQESNADLQKHLQTAKREAKDVQVMMNCQADIL